MSSIKKMWIGALVVMLLGVIACLTILKVNRYVIEFTDDTVEEITLEYGEPYERATVTAIGYGTLLSRTPVPLEVKSEGEVNITKTGQYKIIYRAEFKGQVMSKECMVTVVDTTKPEIILVQDPEHYTSPAAYYEEEGFYAMDTCDGDLTDQVVRKPSEDGKTITYTVSDHSGNTASVTRTVNYKDAVTPEIILGDDTVYIEEGKAYEDRGFLAYDDVDGELTESVKYDTSVVDVNTPGNYAVTYEVADAYGNVAKAVRTVVVNPKAETVNPGDKVIYLTFDDGPYQYTAELLDVLDKYGIKATFFVTNQYPAYQDMIGEEYRRGHTVAIHTYNHDYGDIYSSEERYYEDLNKMQDIIVAQTGQRATLVRFPGGSSNTISANYCKGIMTSLAASLQANGYQYADWNVTSGDAGETESTAKVYENVTSNIPYCDGFAVVLQHDIKGFSVAAVEDIIRWGLDEGYTFLPMTSSTPICHHGINN